MTAGNDVNKILEDEQDMEKWQLAEQPNKAETWT